MRLAKLALALIAASIALPSTASAQSVRNVTDTTRAVDRAYRTLNRTCYGEGLLSLLCQADRISSTVNQVDRAARNYRRAARADATRMNLNDRNPRATQVLGNLCARGDNVACDAVRTMRAEDERLAREEALRSVPRATMTACAQGSQIACDRLRQVIDAR